MEDENAVQSVATNIYGDVCLRKARRKRRKLLITELFFDYTRNTTLHGIPYVTKRGLTMAEKIFWIITFIISVSWCSVSIYQLWYRWTTSPVIVTISEQVVPVGLVPFPSITICPQAKCKVSVYNYTEEVIQMEKYLEKYEAKYMMLNEDESLYESYNLSTIERINKLHDISQICKAFPNLPLNRKFINSSLINLFDEVSPKYEDVFSFCKLRGENPDWGCENTFKKVLTKEGFCFTVNSLPYTEIFRTEKIQKDYKYLEETNSSKGWTIERGYNNSVSDPYPRHGIENAVAPELIVELTENMTDRNDLCNTLSNGFKVYIHHPSDLPQSSLYYYAVINNQVSSIALSFNILNTSESLKSYPAETRQCYFSGERYLKYFSNYTAKNCWIECLSNYTFGKCGCVSYYMPHNDSEQICAEGSFECANKAQDELVEAESRSSGGCHCLPACFSVDYEAEILKTDYDRERWIKTIEKMYNYKDDTNGLKYSRLEIYYKRPRFLSMRRSELFGITEFLANCGGLLGLFMGFSFLTLVEFIYFLTLRLWCTLRKDLKEEKTQAKLEIGNPKKIF